MRPNDGSRIYIHEDLTKIENRVNVALFGMMTQDWFREWFLEKLDLAKGFDIVSSNIYEGVPSGFDSSDAKRIHYFSMDRSGT